MGQAVKQTGDLPVPGSPITLQLTDDRLVSVPLRTIDQDGAFVLSLQHPSALGVDKFLTISWESGRRWVLADARVLAPRFRPHPEAGKLRLRPERPAGTPSGRPAPAPTTARCRRADGSLARRGRRRPSGRDGDRPRRSAVGGRPLGVLRPWQGEHPTVNVAMRLSSGRVRTIDVRRIDEEAALVLELPRPSSIADGEEVEVAWCTRYDWLTARTQVMPSKTGADADAGLLRLGSPTPPTSMRTGAAASAPMSRSACAATSRSRARPTRAPRCRRRRSTSAPAAAPSRPTCRSASAT